MTLVDYSGIGRAWYARALRNAFGVTLEDLPPFAGQTERWYTVELAGQRSGYMRSAQKTENGRITTSTQMHISMGRGDHPMTVEMSGEFVETTGAKPLTMRMVQKLGTVPKTVDYTFG